MLLNPAVLAGMAVIVSLPSASGLAQQPPLPANPSPNPGVDSSSASISNEEPSADASPVPATEQTASYEELVRRVEALERAAAGRTPPPGQAASTAGAFVQNKFNPDISIVVDLTYAHSNRKDEVAESLSIPGYLDESERGGKLRGINFNYFELAFSAAVDPYFDFFGVVAVEGGHEVHVEEAYIDSRQLPLGFQLRLGKFMSAFGRLNGMHKHYWSFIDAPLVFESFIGGEGLKNPGLRLSWTAPVDFLLQANAEVYQGVFDESRTFNAAGYELTATDGTTLPSKMPPVPALYVGSLKTSFDVGDHILLLGGSIMVGHSTITRIEGAATDIAFSAPGTILYDAELTYKYLIDSYRSVEWQTEYIGRLSSGEVAMAADGLKHPERKHQGGLYSQIVWRFDEHGQWRAGARLDLLTQSSVTIDQIQQPSKEWLPRYAAMLEFSPTEFSRFRLQYGLDRSRYREEVRRDIHEVMLQVNFAVGPHGAHTF